MPFPAGTKDLLHALAGHVVRVLTALEPGGLHHQARRNAASAAALASVHRREAQEIDRWIAAMRGSETAQATASGLREAR